MDGPLQNRHFYPWPSRPSIAESRVPSAAGDWRSDRAAFWARSLRGWDLAFYALWALSVLAYFLDRPTVGVGLGVALAVFTVLLVAYLTVGRRAAVSGSPRLATTYLVVMIACVGAVVSATETGTLLLFIAYSQIWYFAENRRWGITLTVALTAVVFGAIAAQAELRTFADAVPLLTQATIAVAFSVILGLWVTQVAEQSEERADLLARLEEAQADAATSHHAAGVMAERERMAREIHDTLAQGFTSVIMLAQTAAADLRRDERDAAGERLALIERTARDNLAEARALVAAGAPLGLTESTLIEALERLAIRFGQETGVRVGVVADDAALAGLPRDREVVLLRAAQEALSNVRRHARARNVDLVLAADTDDDGQGAGGASARVRLTVFDDGQGMDPAAVEGYGLRGMRDRVTSEGGRLVVSSDVGVGTRVQVTVPSGAPDSSSGTADSSSGAPDDVAGGPAGEDGTAEGPTEEIA